MSYLKTLWDKIRRKKPAAQSQPVVTRTGPAYRYARDVSDDVIMPSTFTPIIAVDMASGQDVSVDYVHTPDAPSEHLAPYEAASHRDFSAGTYDSGASIAETPAHTDSGYSHSSSSSHTDSGYSHSDSGCSSYDSGSSGCDSGSCDCGGGGGD